MNRPEQNGPEIIGEGTNGQGLNLNRDFVKAEAPETRAALAAIAAWDPDVFMDLHTTDGSFHGYALTYAPSLNPDGGARRRLRARLDPPRGARAHEARGTTSSPSTTAISRSSTTATSSPTR